MAPLLGAGDTIEVRVALEPDLSGIFRVATDGTVTYPLCGPVVVAGLRRAQLASRLHDCLLDYLKRPQVTVEVREYRPVTVFGQVQHPGSAPYQPGLTLTQALMQAGGFSERANRGAVRIRHAGPRGNVVVSVDDIVTGEAKDVSLRPGDRIFVPER